MSTTTSPKASAIPMAKDSSVQHPHGNMNASNAAPLHRSTSRESQSNAPSPGALLQPTASSKDNFVTPEQEPQDYINAGSTSLDSTNSSQTEVDNTPSGSQQRTPETKEKRLTWCDGEALTQSAAATRPSFSESVANKLSHLAVKNPNGEPPLKSPKSPKSPRSPKNNRDGQGGPAAALEVEEEFKEASVPVPRYWLLTVATCFGLFLSIVDTSIVATSIYTIGMHFNDMRTVNWVALAYTLTYLCFAVTFARISDVIGRRKAFMLAYIIFFGFSLACGFSQSMPQLIAFRALQGIGGSGLYSLTLVILPELSPRHLKGHVSSIVGLVIACSGAAGPVLGGVLTEYTTWRWVFWINGPIGAISMIGFYFAWPRPEQLPTLPKRSWKQFDYLGTFLLIASAVLMVFPFQNAGENGSDTWAKAEFIVPLILGVLLLLALIAWSLYAQATMNDRIMLAFPIGLFRNMRYVSSTIVTLLAGFPYLMIIYAFPIRLQVVSHEEPLMAGVMLLPMLGTLAIGAAGNGALNKVKNYTAETLLAGTILMTLGCGLMIMVDGSEDDNMALGFLTFVGLGFGLVAGSASLFTLFECPISDYAPAQGIIAQVRILGGSFGIAASTALTDNRQREYLSDLFTEDQLLTLGHDNDEPITMEQAQGLNLAYTKAYQDGMIVCTVIVAVSIFVAAAAIRPGKRKLVAEMQDDLVVRENKRRSMAVMSGDDWEAEVVKRGWRLGSETQPHRHNSGSGSGSETEVEAESEPEPKPKPKQDV